MPDVRPGEYARGVTKKELDDRFAAMAASIQALSEARRESAHRHDAFASRMEAFAARQDIHAERMDAISDRMARMEHDLSSMRAMLEQLVERKTVAGFASG